MHSKKEQAAKRFPYIGEKFMNKMKKGFFKSTVTNGGILFIQYKDNGSVIIASTACGIEPKHFAQRIQQPKRKRSRGHFPTSSQPGWAA